MRREVSQNNDLTLGRFFLAFNWFFHTCWQLESSIMETWSGQSSQTQKDSLGPPNSTIKSTSCLVFPIQHISRETEQKDELQESVVSGSDISCRDTGGLEVLGPYLFLSEADSKIQSCILNPSTLTPESKVPDITLQCRLECANCWVKQAGSLRWKML